jgi:hypothetical protein
MNYRGETVARLKLNENLHFPLVAMENPIRVETLLI